MTPLEYAKQLKMEGADIVRINKKTVTIKNGDKIQRVGVPVESRRSEMFNWFFTVVILCCTMFIGLQLKKHTERVEKLENQLRYEIYIHKLSRGGKNE